MESGFYALMFGLVLVGIGMKIKLRTAKAIGGAVLLMIVAALIVQVRGLF